MGDNSADRAAGGRRGLSSVHMSPFTVIALLVASIFLIEAAVMVLLHRLRIDPAFEILLDSATLTLLFIPVVYFIVYRPLIMHVKERTYAEEALRDSEGRLTHAQRIAHLGYWDWNIANNTLLWSDEVYRIFGVSSLEFEVTYEGFLSFVHPEDREFVRDAVSQALDKRTPYDIEHRVVRPDGSVRVVHERAEVISDRAGMAVRMVGTVFDITGRKRAEDELKRSRDLLEFISRAQSRFISDAQEKVLFGELLEGLIGLTDSECGFMGEVFRMSDGKPYLRVYAISDIAWDNESREIYEGIKSRGLEFCNLDTLFGAVMTGGGPVISNDPESDPRRGGLPPGHPPLGAFLGIPFTYNGETVGMAGVAGRAAGYSEGMLLDLAPLIATYGNIMGAFRANRERLEVEQALRDSEAGLASAQRVARMGSWHWDVEKNEQHWSDEIYRIFGLEPRSTRASYAEFINFVHPADKELVMGAVNDALESKKPYRIEHRVVGRNGTRLIVQEEGEVTFGPDGRALRMLGTVQDITERRQAEAQLQKLSQVLERSTNSVFITDSEGRIEYVNPAFERLSGYSLEEAAGQDPAMLSPDAEGHKKWMEIRESALSGSMWKGTCENRKKSGESYWVNCLISPMRDERDAVTHFLAIQEDITDMVLVEEKVKYLTEYDPATGLLNRARFLELMAQSLAGVNSGSLLLVDIDSLKFVNDRYGHGVGDEILGCVAGLLVETLGNNSSAGKALISRPGEDEFAVYLESFMEPRAREAADLVRKKVEALEFTRHNIRLTVSIGLALAPGHGTTAEGLMTKADAALYRAKNLGQNRVHIYRPEDRDLEKLHIRVESRERIIKGLEEGRFEPWYQPVLDLRTNEVHYEALVRLRERDGHIVLPGDFIDAAEALGLIGSIDRLVLSKTMKLQAQSCREGSPLYFSVNLSGKNLGDEDLLDFLREKILETEARPDHLVFEITETAAVRDLDRAVRFIKSLKSLGCRFSLDDFGVGFTSFVYLKELDVDFIKIDGSFIKRLHEHPSDQLVVKAITGVAKGFGIKTIAEFVETEETLALLKEYGVDYAQGYLIGRPAPRNMP